jgi:hypothetical protein
MQGDNEWWMGEWSCRAWRVAFPLARNLFQFPAKIQDPGSQGVLSTRPVSTSRPPPFDWGGISSTSFSTFKYSVYRYNMLIDICT